jgi:predicted alpha/beta-hydrolase family hydrolase
VFALAFPLHPPGRPDRSRADELAAAGVPVVVVQGDRDAFGSASDIAALGLDRVDVRSASGCDHALRGSVAKQLVVEAVASLLGSLSA